MGEGEGRREMGRFTLLHILVFSFDLAQNTKENRQKSNSYLKDNSRRLYSVTLPLNTRTPDFFSRCF